MQKRWLVKQLPEENELLRLQQELKIPKIILTLLLQKGITTFDEARSFFRPNLEKLHDPFSMKGMKEAVNRLIDAKNKGEKVLIFGDYDVDGTTSVALMSIFLKEAGFEFENYIPDRYKEGYGVSFEGVDFAKQMNCKLIIALDCGITAIDKVEYAKEKNIEFIICDHHLPGEKLPDAIILNPKQAACNYPYKELCGCGIGFKLAQGLTQKMKLKNDSLYDLMDLVAIAIAADIVPITGENRILAFHGLQKINSKKQRKGIEILLQSAKKEGEITLTNVVFMLAPRINAAGRIDTGKNAVDLLISEDDEKLSELANKIEQDNTLRRTLDSEITEEILEKVADEKDFSKRKSTVVYGENWHKGVIGIVASRLIETYFRPTVVLTASGEIASGSVRSVPDYNVHEALKACSDLLLQFGGHAAAAGLTIEIDKIPAFREKFEQVVAKSISPEQLIAQQLIDLEISFSEIFEDKESPKKIPKLKRLLDEFEPTGPKNRKPVFMTKNVFVDTYESRIVGDNHLKLSLYQSGIKLKIAAIAFNLGYLWKEIEQHECIDIVYTLEENTWNDQTTLQLNIKDIRLAVKA